MLNLIRQAAHHGMTQIKLDKSISGKFLKMLLSKYTFFAKQFFVSQNKD